MVSDIIPVNDLFITYLQMKIYQGFQVLLKTYKLPLNYCHIVTDHTRLLKQYSKDNFRNILRTLIGIWCYTVSEIETRVISHPVLYGDPSVLLYCLFTI